MAEEIGPVDYPIVAFPGNRFTGEIAPALADLVTAEDFEAKKKQLLGI